MINLMTFTKGNISTETVQQAIDYASEQKQCLLFPAGKYFITSLELKDNSSIYLDKDAMICAITNEEAWANSPKKPLIFCQDKNNISIRGYGELCCNGWAFVQENGERKKTDNRPESVVVIRNSSNVVIENVKLTETIGWTLHLDNCDDVLLDGVIIRNPPYYKRKNSDGIDINGCRNVTVINCDVETGDDAICLKNIDYSDNYSHPDTPRKDMYNIRVYNCKVSSTCNTTKIGTETVGNIYDVSFEKIRVRKHSPITEEGMGEAPVHIINPLSAISVQSNDGADVHNISFKDYYVEHVDAPIFILLQKRDRFINDFSKSRISDIKIEGIYVKKCYRTSQIMACADLKIENVSIKGLYAHNFEERNGIYDARIPTGKEYPDVWNFGTFPAYGIYARNVKNLLVSDDVHIEDKANSDRCKYDLIE